MWFYTRKMKFGSESRKSGHSTSWLYSQRTWNNIIKNNINEFHSEEIIEVGCNYVCTSYHWRSWNKLQSRVMIWRTVLICVHSVG